LCFHDFAAPLIPNPVTDIDKLVNKLRRRYRTYVVDFDMEHVIWFFNVVYYIYQCFNLFNVSFCIDVQGVVHLPNMFVHDFGDQIDFIATLVDSRNNQFEVYVEKHTNGIYLTRGWRALRDFYKLTLGAWVTMVFVGNNRFEISLKDRVWKKIQCPMFTPSINFQIDRSWLPFQMMDAVPTAYVHSDMSFLYSYEKRLSGNEVNSGWMVSVITLLFAFFNYQLYSYGEN